MLILCRFAFIEALTASRLRATWRLAIAGGAFAALASCSSPPTANDVASQDAVDVPTSSEAGTDASTNDALTDGAGSDGGARRLIASISVCSTRAGGPAGSCPSGSSDTAQLVLAPGGGAINAYGGLTTLSDEHATVLPPSSLPGHDQDYLLLGASVTSQSPGGLVVLTLGTGPDASDRWTADYASDYGLYQPSNPPGQQNGAVFFAAMSHDACETVSGPTLQNATFDLNYAEPGSVVIDPTNPTNTGPGNLLLIYEGTNRCVGSAGPRPGPNFYSSVSIATSFDHGHSWPVYRSNFTALPGVNPSTGPNVVDGAFGAQVCIGNDCTTAAPAGFGRYPVLNTVLTLQTAIASGSTLSSNAGDAEPAAFVDDVHTENGTYLYIAEAYDVGPACLGSPYSNPPTSARVTIGRALLNGGAAPLQFTKWFGASVSYGNTSSGSFAPSSIAAAPASGCDGGTGTQPITNAGLGAAGGGLESPVFPSDPTGPVGSPSFASCQSYLQTQSAPSISYVEETQQYLMIFVCRSPSDPATGQMGPGAAWFYSTLDAAQYDLSRQDQWSAPQEVAGSWMAFPTGATCVTYDGWYPTWMSLGRHAGHLSLSGYVFYLAGCVDSQNGRRYSTRRFTIATQ